MKKVVLFLIIGFISIITFGQQKINLAPIGYHTGGILITKSETPNFIQNLKEVKFKYQKLIDDSNEMYITDMSQEINIKHMRITGYFYVHESTTYDFFSVPEYIFNIKNKQHYLILNVNPTEPGIYNFRGFSIIFKDTLELSKFIKNLENKLPKDYSIRKYFEYKFENINYSLNGPIELIPYYGHTILRDTPKGNKISKVKISLFNTAPVTVLGEGIKYKDQLYLKVKYRQDTGWVSSLSFKYEDLMEVRKNNCIVWVDSDNVKF